MRFLRWLRRLWRKPIVPLSPAPRTSVRILTNVANPAAPTVAELEGGIDVSCYLSIEPIAFDPEPCQPTPWHRLKEGDVIRATYPDGSYREVMIGEPIPQADGYTFTAPLQLLPEKEDPTP